MLYLESGNIIVDNATMYQKIHRNDDNSESFEHGQSHIALRGLYFEMNGHKVVIDPGPGRWIESFFPGYHFSNLNDATAIMDEAGYDYGAVTDIFLTHLHFDHCAGIFAQKGDHLVPAFPGANLYLSASQFKLIENPSEEERGSFLPGFNRLINRYYNVILCDETNKLSYLDDIIFSDGHTRGMMLPVFSIGNESYIYATDLIPTKMNMTPEIVSGYDNDPELLYREKLAFFDTWGRSGNRLIFFHEPDPDKRLAELSV